jgi:aryl-alcohol dehydrogenase-like predicted oxidoreductase
MAVTVSNPALGQVSVPCLGGSVFGWTIRQAESFSVLDAFAEAGGNFLDTADAYSAWVDRHTGGESETIIGHWMKARGNRDGLIVATKFGQLGGVRADAVHSAVDASLRRLQTDRIDLYYAHIDDPTVPLEETLGALGDLVAAGKVRALGACGYSPARLADALAIGEQAGLPRYAAVQPLYNLLERDEYEGSLQSLCTREQLACIPYSGLARGFLSGKYRPGQRTYSKRGAFAWTDEWDARNRAILDTLDAVARAHGTKPAAVAVAWLAAQPGVLAPIISARTAGQLGEALQVSSLELTDEDLRQLTDAGKAQGAIA